MTALSSSSRPWGVRLVHAFIVLHFVAEVCYTGYQTMVVLRPEGASIAPLGAAALTMSDSMFLRRRLYAIENWVAFSGLAIYLAITEIAPRTRREEKSA